MIPPPTPTDEARRLAALRRYAVLDTLPERALDDLTALAARICETPIALITLVDEDRQWFKSRLGLNVAETPRDVSFCGHALLEPGLFIIPDATKDERFADNPMVTGEAGIRFYAGAPLITPEGAALGTLCVKDRMPRTLNPAQEESLRVLAGQVMTQLELRRHARELLESEERLRVVTENARVGLVIVNREHRYLYANEAYAEILGLPSADIAGQRVADVLPALYAEQIQPRLDRAFAGERVAYELRKPGPGSDRCYAVSYEPAAAEGPVELVIVVITDITERIRAEEALHESARFAQSTIDALSANLCVLDETGIILATNEAWRRFAAANPPAAHRADTGANYLQLCDRVTGPEATDAAAFAAGIRAVLRGERTDFALEYPCHSPSEQRWFVGRVTRFPGAGPLRVVVAHENITARKVAEMGSSRMAAIVASSDDAIIGKDLNSVVTSWNRGAEKIFGYTAEEMVGASITLLIPPDRREEEDYILGAIKRGQSVEHFETLRLTKDGRLIDVSVTASPIKDAAGNVTGVSKVARDISERKRAQAQTAWLASIPQNNPNPILELDLAAGVVHYANPAAIRLMPDLEKLGIRHPLLAGLQEVQTVLQSGETKTQWREVAMGDTCFGQTITFLPDAQRLRIYSLDITERKKAEEALRQQAALFEQTYDAVLVWGWNDAITFWNRGAERLYGFPREEAVGRTSHELLCTIFPDGMDRLLLALEQAGQWEGELQHTTLDGRKIMVESRMMLVREPDRAYVLEANRDITGRKQAEQAQRTSEARYRSLFEYAPDGILIADPESRYIDANASACRMFGYTREELIGMHATDIVVPEEIAHIDPALDVIKSQSDYHREWKFRRKDGSVFAAEVIATMMPDGNLLGMIRDVTERKRNEDRFRRLVDSNVQGVMFWNAQGEITGANDAFLGIVGYTREDLQAGRIKWAEMTPPEYTELDCCALKEIGTRGVCAPLEKEYFRKDGSRVPVLVGAATFADNPQEGVCFVLDLTERKKLEQQFLRAQRMESIGTLAGGIAHDLNNVLGPIIMSLDLLKIRFPEPENQELLSIVGTSAQRGADMVRQVLSFARGVEGRRMEVQVKHLIRDIEKICTDTLLKHIQVRTNIPHDLWTVMGDPTQLHQVLLNLCVNARDAMPDGGLLAISAENRAIDAQYAGLNLEARPGPYVFLQIEDSGTGMPPEVMEKIFDPFFTTKEIGKGTGLGLSTSMAIVKSHGGFIQVYSELEKGTKFRIYLPAQIEPLLGAAAEAAVEMPRGHDELILVVDDELSVRQITQQTLQAFGYRVVLAADGAEAVAIYASRGAEIAVVITDMMMPVMDGIATIRVLRKINPAVRIIGASGLSASGHATHAAALGVKHFLPKPYTAEVMLKALREILSGAD